MAASLRQLYYAWVACNSPHLFSATHQPASRLPHLDWRRRTREQIGANEDGVEEGFDIDERVAKLDGHHVERRERGAVHLSDVE